MTYTYSLTNSALAHDAQTVMRSDGACIPFDPANSDFQTYLAWIDAGNTPTELATKAAIVPAQASCRQFFQAAAQEGIITQDEAIALLAIGAIPPSLSAAVASLPSAQQFAAKMAILGNQTFERSNALILALGAAMGKTDADLDALFTLAATL
jgi:hypothetical protein